MDQANILIIGGGVIGCAIAREVSQRWQDVFLVEQFPRVGMATSTRNSGVIHSGIYYPKGSLKARHCVEGNRLSYEFCEKHNVSYDWLLGGELAGLQRMTREHKDRAGGPEGKWINFLRVALETIPPQHRRAAIDGAMKIAEQP